MDKKLRVAILDLYEGQPNQGMRCLREILEQFGKRNKIDLEWEEFEVRIEKQIPDLSFDIYISSGGPGSPLESEHSDWEKLYFKWLRGVEHHNLFASRAEKKWIFLICHSFQLVCRQYNLAEITKRKSTAFGIFPIHLQNTGKHEPVFAGLEDPFFAVDSRDFQAIKPNHAIMHEMGAHVLAIEKERPHVPLERAIMAIRFNDFMIGTQFHPEADAIGMSMYLQREDKKQTVIDEHGIEKWQSMIDHLNDPDKISWTYSHVIPNFLRMALDDMNGYSAN
jgi:GMP synthase-like glutamine amidotransferase